MVNQELIEYINKKVSEGSTKESLISDLNTGGWTESDINEAFEKIIVSGGVGKNIRKNNSDKTMDLFVGFVLGIFSFYVISLILLSFSDFFLYLGEVTVVFMLYSFLALITIFYTKTLFKKNRKFLAVGIILGFVVHILVFGSCTLGL